MNEFRETLGLQFFAEPDDGGAEPPMNEPAGEPVGEPSADPQVHEPQVNTQEYRDTAFREVLSMLNLTNPATNQPFANEGEWNQYMQAFAQQEREQQEQARQQQLREQGVDPEMLSQAIAANPTVQQAQQMIQQAREAEGTRALNEAVSEISKIDPSIKEFGDLLSMPNFQEFDRMVRRGYSLPDAYKLANYDTLSEKRSAAAKQAALNSVNGKGHLVSTKGGAGDDVVIPQGTLDMYRRAFPGKDESWYLEQYKKFR